MGDKRTLEDRQRCFVFICALQDEDERILGLFQIGHLAALRIFKDEVQEWVRGMNIGEALRDSGIGDEILREVDNENTIDVIQRYLASRDEELLEDDEYKALVGLPRHELNQIVMEFVSGMRERKTLRYVSGLDI
ncbi:hypothetical protein IE4872_CH02482 [Rhizobium gallicum]|uniref:Uncharacterized protein n=1 Tax=Rhizobium gallicum TaxID=56730 RepID=A0A1L5NJP9_9HYPH|nr:hypothetical protein [Rhizobium gallicum]APO68092.1 hypothetical protein IE4872_CH02482 [Rhizobium gallicum]